MVGQVYDNHTLFVRCDTATTSQIKDVFKNALTTYNMNNNNSLSGSFHVNIVETRNKVSLGIAFVFFTNPAAYHMILGKNPDGSDRIEYRDDPSWVSVQDTWSPIIPGSSWGDIAEEEESKLCPKIPITMEPLISLPSYKLTDEQIQEKKDKIIMLNKDKEGFSESMVNVPDHSFLTISPAMANPLEDKFVANILKAKDVPSWVTNSDLKMRFAPYSSNSKTIVDRIVKGRHFQETYPFININSDGIAFVIFDPSTHDAQFALHMVKKLYISKKMSDGTTSSATLIFNHSYSTDRDRMSEIIQKPSVISKSEIIKKKEVLVDSKKINKFAGLVVEDDE
jgi:hypothetical protein